MPSRDSLYPQDWFRIGEKDLKRAEHLLTIDDAEGAGYHLQQAVDTRRSKRVHY
jgi:HEPN domain